MKEIITYSAELQYIWDLQQRAEKSDDATAQLNLAKFYLRLKQESTNRKAFALLKKLARQGYTTVQTDAQFMLAECYENRYGIQKNYPRAIKWYISAVHNITYDLMHRPDPVGDSAYQAFKEAVENRDMAKRLLANLPPEQREAVLLRYGEGLKYREIAAVTGQPLRTVQSRVRKALKTLREGKL